MNLKYADEESLDLFGVYDADLLMNDLGGTADMDLRGSATGRSRFQNSTKTWTSLSKSPYWWLSALLKNLQTGFMSEGAGQIAFYVCYMVMISCCLSALESNENGYRHH